MHSGRFNNETKLILNNGIYKYIFLLTNIIVSKESIWIFMQMSAFFKNNNLVFV